MPQSPRSESTSVESMPTDTELPESDARPRPDSGARRLPVAGILAVVLGLLVLTGSAFGGELRFSGPRWNLGGFPSATPPAPPSQPADNPTASPPATSGGSPPDLTWLVVVVACLAALALAVVVIRWWRSRRRDRPAATAASLDELSDPSPLADDPSIETSAPYLRRGLRLALDLLDGDRAPNDAIVAAWLGLQEAAEDAGYSRLDSETPTEFTSRILRLTGVDGEALGTLRRLYLAVRFGDAVATPADVVTARHALVVLEAQWAERSAHPADDGGHA
ncbi:uncharacterized protein DUF4129 [Frondihabitans sp. PhB161]|nr:uncharacterized protein DUF4129 [Frondihabitans sp. PhB153]RPF08592.1 uncharacterized protein DUF4129 [Frondihabitans sp. PhB161]